MFDLVVLASVTEFFLEGLRSLSQFINGMNVLQWGILSFCGVIFGFLCLKGSNIG